MIELNVVTNELNQKGFEVTLLKNSIKVELTNRKVSTMEIQIALLNNFGEIDFDIKSYKNSVIVKL